MFAKSKNLKICCLKNKRAFSASSEKFKNGQKLNNFTINKIKNFKKFNLNLVQMTHRTGANYVHISAKDNNNVFGIAFKTPNYSDNGIPHILEHCVLCGSKKYPINDPFMKMQNRSLSTFMNAMTYQDRTFYPFRSHNQKDFQNIRDIYLDAVFNPNLSVEDVLREGSHCFIDPKVNEKRFGGIVFNEMKAHYSNPDHLIYQSIKKSILFETNYRFDSYGEPLSITNITREQLLDFHRKFYSAQNSLFYSYGDLDLNENTNFIDKTVLKSFPDNSPLNLQIPEQSFKNLDVDVDVPVMITPDVNQKTPFKASISFLCENVKKSQEIFDLKILSYLLIGDRQSFLYKEIIEKGIGTDFAMNSGLNDEFQQSVFTFGIESLAPDQLTKFKILILNALNKACEKNFSKKRINSILHQIELNNKTVSSEKGLKYGFSAVKKFAHNIDQEDTFKITEKIKSLKQNLAKNPKYFAELIQKHLLSNKHRIVARTIPKMTYMKDLELKEQNLLSEVKSEKVLSDEKILKNANLNDDLNILPSLDVKDITPKIQKEPVSVKTVNGLKVYESVQPTNGICHFSVNFDVEKIVPVELRPLLPFFSVCLTEFGAGDLSSDELNEQIDLHTGGIYSTWHVGTATSDRENPSQSFLISSHCLKKNNEKMAKIYLKILEKTRFDDFKKIDLLLEQQIVDKRQHIISDSLQYTNLVAASTLSKSAKLREKYFGLKQLKFLTNLKNVESEQISKNLNKILQILRENGPNKIFVGGEKDVVEDMNNILAKNFGETKLAKIEDKIVENFGKFESKKVLLRIMSRNNSVSACFKTVYYDHEDYAALSVLSRLMNWNYLHNEIRVKGNAYGSGAYQKYDIFGMYSLADPNCAKTLKTFQNCIEWASNDENKTENNKVEQMTENDVKKAILATFSTIDSPVSPSKRGKAFFVNGMSDETRQKIRDRLLKVDKKSILRVARKYLLGNSKFVGQNSKNGEISNASISVAGAVDVTEKKRLEDVLEWTEIQNNF